MASYLEITNDFNSILIDDNYDNLIVLKSGTVTLTTEAAMNRIAVVTFTLPAGTSVPMIAAYYPNYIHLYNANVESNGNCTWKFAVEGPVGSTFNYWIFGLIAEKTGDGKGLFVVKNATDQIVFDSGYEYARVRDFVTYDFDTSQTLTYDATRKYAVVFVQACLKRQTGSGPGGQWSGLQPHGAFIRDNGTVTYGSWIYRALSGSGGLSFPTSNRTARYMLVDVTGY